MAYIIDNEKCLGCGACISACPVSAISFDDEGKVKIDDKVCVSCGTCAAVCPVGAPKGE